ncbi:amidohydrolase family protein [Echinimonas agarilytica]|uniref:Amidohydrolase family protein n=1 Tax=Echinimonas agarilytica TaxID=1215918 RepID=A0AA42B713_9GAMM|nr:amidohydrolase family protein [Echinimonas agarilytica]MCM2679345.1 amidohydrolase family protein [Echinimonas agarilytica]
MFKSLLAKATGALLITLTITPAVFAAPEEAPAEESVTPFSGSTHQLNFSTNEGTWLNLDISPDGEQIVFDLLGDLFLLPIDGGKAVRLTTSTALEVQPKFSPDGKTLTYISDRDGAHNVWLMNIETGEETPLTTEDFRLLTNPTWTPDGKSVIARKHFTGTRSLGTGEMWLYRTDGGKGIQLTKQPNEQQDVNEPSVSPDGRYLFYSQDTTAGPYFQYNKDPHKGIYSIKRKDLKTGETITLISGAGGAARPTVSPDGRYIAFVKRVDMETVLYLYDRQSGEQKALYSKLNHDQQEAWAIFGVYANFAWTPDSESLVFWADGKIQHIDIDSQRVADIAFEADVDMTLTHAVKAKPVIDSDNFDVKMIRDITTSPNGSYRVFHALGKLYIQSTKGGKVKRLTNLDGFQYAPSFSPDGKKITFTSWSDDDYGHVYVATFKGRRGISKPARLTEKPGHYLNPKFSANSRKVVYQRAGGNNLRGYFHGTEPGIYWQNVGDRTAHFVTRQGRQPLFSPDGERVWVMQGHNKDKKLVSYAITGGDAQDAFSLGSTQFVALSLDGQYMAIQDGFKVYLVPYVQTGTELDLNAKIESIAVTAMDNAAGNYLHFSNKALHWGLGNTIYSYNLENHETSESVVEFTTKQDKPEGSVAYTNARIITMQGDNVIEQGTIITDGNRIVSVGASEGIEIPSDAIVFDLNGKTIVPGFVDTHAHVNHFKSSPLAETNPAYYANLAFGVTTTHDPSANTETVFSQAELVKAGLMVGPRIFSTGGIIYGAGGDYKVEINSLDDALLHLKRLQAQGAFSIKSYNQPRRDQRQQIIEAARQLGIAVYPEGGSTFYNNLTQIIDGSTGVEHNLPIAPLYNDVQQLWAAANDVGYTPTLVVNYGGINGEFYWYQHDNVWEHPLLSKYTSGAELRARSMRRLKLPETDFYYQEVAAAAKQLSDLGVKVNIGSHGQLQGMAYHWEMWMLSQGGFTPMEMLRAATLNGAEYLGMGDELGSIESGKLADLVILSKNPLEDVRYTDSVEMVVINGRIYETKTMNEVGHRDRVRGHFYFEHEGSDMSPSGMTWGISKLHTHMPTCPAHEAH